MARFYCPLPLAAGTEVDLPEVVAHHLHVVRAAVGDELILFNGAGGEYLARLADSGKRRALARVVEFRPREAELAYPVTLAQGLPEGGKMDWIVEKAVEMGVAALQPVAAQRSVVRLAEGRADRKLAHWQGVVVAASEQCGRNRLMPVAHVQPLAPVARAAGPAALLLSPRGTQSLAAWARAHAPQPLTLLVGPEGGWSPEEEAVCLAAGATPVGLGERVLRTETAAIAAMGMLAAVWG